METKATLKVVRTRVKRVPIYSKLDNATFRSLPWTQVVNFIPKETILCSYVPATGQSTLFACLLVGCLTSQQQASVSQVRICKDNFTCCHTEIEVADQTFYLTQSQYTDTGLTSPSTDPLTPGAWQGSHWSANF